MGPTQLWEAVRAGRSLLSTVDKDRWGVSRADALAQPGTDTTDRTVSDRGGYVRGFSQLFDPEGFHVPAREILTLDPVFQWVLHTAREALREARAVNCARTTAIFGNLSFPSRKMAELVAAVSMQEGVGEQTRAKMGLAEPDPRNRFNSGLPALLLSRALGLGCGAFALDAACASSLYAIKLACDRLRDGSVDVALAGAVNCADDLCIHVGFTALKALSPSGQSRPFHADADGLVPAEGCAFVALKRLDDALRDGDTIHGVVRAVGLSNDGRGRGLLVPSQEGQVRAMRAAYAEAQLSPRDLGYVECHATGTRVGDAVELQSLAEVFGEGPSIAVGSLKANTGHLITAAGVAGLIKVLEAMAACELPPTLPVETATQALRNGRFHLVTSAEPWRSEGPRRAAVSAFGFGGNNAHLIVEQWSGRETSPSGPSFAVSPEPIAIVAIGVKAARADGLDDFRSALFGSQPQIEVEADGRQRARLAEFSLSLKGLKFPPLDLARSLPQQTAMLEVASEALRQVRTLPGQRTGVFVGMGVDPGTARFGLRWRLKTWAKQVDAEAAWTAEARELASPPLDAAAVLGNMPNMPANRLSSQFDLGGPSLTLSSEEHSGLDALSVALRALRAQELDAALVGAVDFSCQPAHERAAASCLAADRQVPGDAAVILVLKRVRDALRDGDHVYGVLTGEVMRAEAPQEGGGAASPVLTQFGHAHAARALLELAASAIRLEGAQAGEARASISITAMDGSPCQRHASVEIASAHSHGSALKRSPRLYVFAGSDATEVLRQLASRQESLVGPARLVIVASDEAQLEARAVRARAHIERGAPAGEGVHFRGAPIAGEMAFVFTGAGTAYRGMGEELMAAFPQLERAVSQRFGDIRTAWHWMTERETPTPTDFLWGASTLSQLHAELTLRVMGLRPHAAIGYSSGESNSLYAFGVWNDLAAMQREIEACGMMERELGGEFAAVSRAWGRPARWSMWNIRGDVAQVQSQIEGNPYLHLAIINTDYDVVVGGDEGACEKLARHFGAHNSTRLSYNLACHVPEVAKQFHTEWLRVHSREVTPHPQVRFYSNGVRGSYTPSRETCARVITAQAESALDFRATIERAYADGVRIFVEHGPGRALSHYIREILGNREALVLSLDRKGNAALQAFEVGAALLAAGIDVDRQVLTRRPPLTAATSPTLTIDTRPAPLNLPPLRAYRAQDPAMPSASRSSNDSPVVAPMPHAPRLPPVLQRKTPVLQRKTQPTATPCRDKVQVVAGDEKVATHVSVRNAAASALPWNKAQLAIHASGQISTLFGPAFAQQDGYPRQCRMPEPPLLLADRVTRLEAEPGVLGQGTVWTETDVERGAWYLHDGRMPAGFMIESGQADLMLISYMGIDFENRGERVYRLLGCTLTYHGDLPQPGETLAYEIRITGHARHGSVRIFFFEYDCVVDGKPRLTVTRAQAGFFTDQELENALGVLWDPEQERLDPYAQVAPPTIACTRARFSQAEVRAFSEGRAYACFGEGFERAETHSRSPRIQHGDQLFIDEVLEFDPRGGPWKRGFMRVRKSVSKDDWYFAGHFKNDPCMPGNFMVEACLQAMSLYLAALGYTVSRDGYRFQPLREHAFELKCRGEISPSSREVIYELYVREVDDGDKPHLIADVLGWVDGRKSFLGQRLGLELVPDWPLSTLIRPEDMKRHAGQLAKDADGFVFDYRSLLACAWGKPSEAFGRMYEPFDNHRRVARLPAPPYHFMSRVTRLEGGVGSFEAGMRIEVEYDVPPDAWYFEENGNRTMPFAVLLEAALQPCGWTASALGSALTVDGDLMFRNLDGTGNVLKEIGPDSGVLRTLVEATRISSASGMIIEGFRVECFVRSEKVFDMDTVFGFFPASAFEDQAGLPVSASEREWLERPSDRVFEVKDYDMPARLANRRLRMIDRVSGYFPSGGEACLGVLRGERDVCASDWFFKAHFFQDPVQPGSLGLEGMLQALQLLMLERGMAKGLKAPRFQAIATGIPLTWKYRGQITPECSRVTTVVELREVGVDEAGPYAIARASLWVDKKRIYSADNLGMRILSEEVAPTVKAAGAARPMQSTGIDIEAAVAYWADTTHTPSDSLASDLQRAVYRAYVGNLHVNAETLKRLQESPAIYLANHQVQLESAVATNLISSLTCRRLITLANRKHESRWIGRYLAALSRYPGSTGLDVVEYFDPDRPETMFEILARVREELRRGTRSFFLHPQGQRGLSAVAPVSKVSAVFLDLALDLDLPIVPVRISGGLPVEPLSEPLELPYAHARQDYALGQPLEAPALRALRLPDRVARVRDALNHVGGLPAAAHPGAGDPARAERVLRWQNVTGADEALAALFVALTDLPKPCPDTQRLLAAAQSGVLVLDTSAKDAWLGEMARLLFGARGPRVSSPHA